MDDGYATEARVVGSVSTVTYPGYPLVLHVHNKMTMMHGTAETGDKKKQVAGLGLIVLVSATCTTLGAWTALTNTRPNV